MDTFQMNQDWVSEKSWLDMSSEEMEHQRDYLEKHDLFEDAYLLGYRFTQVQKKDLLVASGEEPILRFEELEARFSSYTLKMYSCAQEKINTEAFRNETASTFEGVGIAKEDTFRFLTLGKIARSVFDLEVHNKLYNLLENLEVFYKLSSRGTLSKKTLINHTAGLLDEMDSIIPYLLKNKSGISTELSNELLDIILPIKRSVKSVYFKIESPDNRYEALKKKIDFWGEEKIQDSDILLLRYQEVIEDIDTLLDEKNDQGKSILSTEQREVLTDSRAKLRLDFSKTFEQTVVTDDWATKDAEMRQFQRGFFFVCESVECKDPEQLGTLRLKKMKDFVASMVNKWTPHDSEIPESWLKSHAKSIVEVLKKQIVENGKITNLIAYLFPMRVDHRLRMMTDWEEYHMGKIKDYDLTGVMPAFFKGLDQTMGDVIYWAWKTEADSIASFELCGSDMHDSGLGVCKVDFQKGGISNRYVIKPDGRQFEKIVFGKQGFVEEFNRSVKEGRVSLIDDSNASDIKRVVLGKIKGIDAVRTFEMQSSESNKHGVLIERLEVGQVSKSSGGEEEIDGEVNSQGRLFAQLICGIFGIGDLHEQNVGYWETYLKKIFYPALIDSECGMDLFILGSFTEASKQGGFSKVKIDEKLKLSIDERLFRKLIDCINVLFDRRNPIRCRHVPIGTTKQEELRAHFLSHSLSEVKEVVRLHLDRWRGTALNLREENSDNPIEEHVHDFESYWASHFDGNDEIDGINRDTRLLALYDSDKLPIFESTDSQFETALNCAIEDYYEGKIPFYEINPVTGELTTRDGAVVGQFMPKLSVNERIEMMKKIMMSNIYVGEEKAWDYYQRIPSLSSII